MPTKMETAAANNGNENTVAEAVAAPVETEVAAESTVQSATKKPVQHWPAFIRTATPQDIKERLSAEIAAILKQYGLEQLCCLALIEPLESIDSFDLDQIFRALNQLNHNHDKDVVLFILSRGSEGEPAYQISKICKSFAHAKFTAVVPRHASLPQL